MACGSAQARDTHDLVPVRQTTTVTADHDDGFSYARTTARDQARCGGSETGRRSRPEGWGVGLTSDISVKRRRQSSARDAAAH